MKKQLRKRVGASQKSLELYAVCLCGCSCTGCASVPSSDYVNVRNSRSVNTSWVGNRR